MTTHQLTHHAGHLFMTIGEALWLIGTGSPQSFSDVPILELDGISLRMRSNFRGVNSQTLSTLTGTPTVGLLGADVLNQFDIICDLPSSQIMFSSEPVDMKGRSVSVQSFQGIPIIDAVIGGQNARVFLETGAKLSYWHEASLVNYPATGVFEDFYPGIGLFQVDTYRVPVGIGGRNFDIRFGVPTTQVLSMLRMAGVTAILGNEIFQNQKIGFQPRQNSFQFL